MKTVTVEELLDPKSGVLDAVKAGERFVLTDQGKAIARILPTGEIPIFLSENGADEKVDWTTSAAFAMDKSKMRMLTAEEVASILGRD